MHDVIGGAGMLRGWVSIWTSQMMWFLAAMTLSVGIVAMAELCGNRWLRLRAEAKQDDC